MALDLGSRTGCGDRNPLRIAHSAFIRAVSQLSDHRDRALYLYRLWFTRDCGCSIAGVLAGILLTLTVLEITKFDFYLLSYVSFPGGRHNTRFAAPGQS